jgi:hypothetical protein
VNVFLQEESGILKNPENPELYCIKKIEKRKYQPRL